MHELHEMYVFGIPGPLLFICGLVWWAVLVAWIGNNPVALAITAFLSILTAKAYIIGSKFVREFHFGPSWKMVFILMGIAIIVVLVFLYGWSLARYARYARYQRVHNVGTPPYKFTKVPVQTKRVPKRQRQPPIFPPPPQPANKKQPLYLYHGTPEHDSAMDILANNRWLVGVSDPQGVWLTDSFDYAEDMAGNGGYILQVYVDPRVRLKKIGHDIYLAHIPNAVRHSQYYTLPGIRALGIATKTQSKAA
jgi:hypothetical protein